MESTRGPEPPGKTEPFTKQRLVKHFCRKAKRLHGTELGRRYFEGAYMLLESDNADELQGETAKLVNAIGRGDAKAIGFVVDVLSQEDDDTIAFVIKVAYRIGRARFEADRSQYRRGTLAPDASGRFVQRARPMMIRARSRERRASCSTRTVKTAASSKSPAGSDPEPPPPDGDLLFLPDGWDS